MRKSVYAHPMQPFHQNTQLVVRQSQELLDLRHCAYPVNIGRVRFVHTGVALRRQDDMVRFP